MDLSVFVASSWEQTLKHWSYDLFQQANINRFVSCYFKCLEVKLAHSRCRHKYIFVFGPSEIQITSLQSQISSQETDLRSQEDELSRTKANLSRLQEEEAQLEQSLLSARVRLDSIIKSLKTTQEEISQVSADNETTGYMNVLCHVWPLSCLLDLVLCGIK